MKLAIRKMKYLIAIYGLLSIFSLYCILQYTDYQLIIDGLIEHTNDEFHYKEVEQLIQNITFSFGEICEKWKETIYISPENCNLSSACLVYKNMNTLPINAMKHNQDLSLKNILDFYNRHFNSQPICFTHVKNMMELNTLRSDGKANFYFPIPKSIFTGRKSRVSETVKEFMNFLEISAKCIGDNTNFDWSHLALPEENDETDNAEIHEKINSLNNSVQLISMKLDVMTEEIKIQQSSVRLNNLLCVLVTSDQRQFFNEKLLIHFYLCFGSILVMVTFHKYPFLPFALEFFGNVVYTFVYDRLTGKAFKIRNIIWTFKMIEESKRWKIMKPDKMSKIKLTKHQKPQKFRKNRKRN